MDVKVVNPCPDEVAKLKAAGLAVAERRSEDVFTKDVGVKTIQGVPILFGYNVRADMPEDVVYKMLSAFYKNRDKLAKADPGFTPDGQGLRRHAGARHQRQSEIFRCIRAWPSSSRSTRPGTTSGRLRAAQVDR